jgi:hypothetical protein
MITLSKFGKTIDNFCKNLKPFRILLFGGANVTAWLIIFFASLRFPRSMLNTHGRRVFSMASIEKEAL